MLGIEDGPWFRAENDDVFGLGSWFSLSEFVLLSAWSSRLQPLIICTFLMFVVYVFVNL